MHENIPKHLSSTFTILKSSYPNDIPSDAYLPLLRLLYEEMSDRNLALVVGELIDKNTVQVLNDIYKAATSVRLKGHEVRQVQRVLSRNGYDKWLKEE